jgi:ribonuclease-3
LPGNYITCSDGKISLIEELFESVPKDVMVVRSSIDSKNKLQEFVQANGAITPPTYDTEQVGGMSHAPEFLAKVYVNGKVCGEGKGRNKKDAEKEAAADALAKLKKRGVL